MNEAGKKTEMEVFIWPGTRWIAEQKTAGPMMSYRARGV
jgi:hypothetical protein